MERSNSPVFFGEWVKRRRKALDLTQEELAHRAGCSVFALRKIESGERRPSKQLADLLARSLEISSEEKQTFIRVARGEANLERLRSPSLDSSLASISDFQPASPPSRIPLQPKPVIGRESELSAMERLFNDPQCRLLTLTGMGGIGKTSLAIEFATRQSLSASRGVFYVPLASINSFDAIVPAMADALGFVFSGPIDPKEQLINYIALQLKQSVLLVLDNLEHLLVQSPIEEKTGAVELISEFLQRLPNAKILATSREHLNLQGEWTYELHGLPIPPLDYEGKVEDYSAAALFVQSARRAKVGFEVTDIERSALIRICHLLDGIPLAIELAAAWVGMLSCQEIAQEIGSNIDFLTTSMRDIPERHRSIRASIDHSWKLLSGAEQRVLCHLSVFHGGFDRYAAEKIAGASLPLLASLVSKSLVRRTENGHYDLHEVIRQYALSLLNGDPKSDEICNRHCEYYLKLVADQETALKSAAQQTAMRELTREMDNIRAAWVWAIERKKFDLLGKSIRSLGWMFEVGGLLREGIEQLELVLQALQVETRNDQLDRLLGLTLMQQGLLYFRTGQFVRAEENYKGSIAILRPSGDQALLADALIFLGTITHLNGEYAQSRDLIREGLGCAQASNDRWFEAYAIYNLGYVDSLMGDYQSGYEQMLVGLDMWRAIGDPHYIALGLNFLVSTLIKLGRYEEAKALMSESIALCEKTKNRWGMGTAYRYLGSAYLAEGQYCEAQTHFRKSLEIFGEYTEGWDIALSLFYLGEVAVMEGNLTEARKNFLKALRISIDSHSTPIALDILLRLAHLQVQAGKPEHALEISYHVLNHPSITQETKDRANQLILELTREFQPDQVKALGERVKLETFEMVLTGLLNSSTKTEHGETLV